MSKYKMLEKLNELDIHYDKIKVFALINLYEFILGSILSFIYNGISYFFFKYVPDSENYYVSFVLNCISISIIITAALLLREFVELLPGIYEHKDAEWFYHPSPIALTFGFWNFQSQLKLRNKNLRKMFVNLLPNLSEEYINQLSVKFK
jgi:hypothetical protein